LDQADGENENRNAKGAGISRGQLISLKAISNPKLLTFLGFMLANL
jgi:hypothetical protein